MTHPTRRHAFHLALAASLLSMTCGSAFATAAQATATAPASATAKDAAKTTYEPKVGQPGKDVMWVPTADTLVDQMLRMAAITPQDYLVDLGSGDGRTVITAALRGTRAHGIEYNPDLVELSKKAAKSAGVAGKATFAKADIFETDFSDATVVTLFLLPEINLQLRPILLKMKPGTRIVSNSFDMGDWAADETAEVSDQCRTYCHAFKWIVPAQVEGSWALDDKSSLEFTQQYQNFTGHLVGSGTQHTISEGALNGTSIVFRANGRQYKGEVKGSVMQGTDDAGKAWTARRKG